MIEVQEEELWILRNTKQEDSAYDLPPNYDLCVGSKFQTT